MQKILEIYQDWLKTHRYVKIFGFNLSLVLLFYLLLLFGLYQVMELSLFSLVTIGRIAQEYLTHYPEVIYDPAVLEANGDRLLKIKNRDQKNYFDREYYKSKAPFDPSNYNREGVLRVTSICNDSKVAFQHTIYHLLGSASVTYLYTNIYTKRKLNQFFDLYPHLFKNFPQPQLSGQEAIYIVTQKPEIPFSVRNYIVHRHSLISSLMVFGFTFCMSFFAQNAYFYYNANNLPYSTVPFMLLVNSFPYSSNVNPSIAVAESTGGKSRSQYPPPPPLDDSSIQTSSLVSEEYLPINIKNKKTIDWRPNKKFRIIFKRNDWKELLLDQQDKLMNLFSHSGLALTSAVGIYLLAYPMPFLIPYLLTYSMATFMFPRDKIIITDILYRPLNDPLGVVYAYRIDAQVMTLPEFDEFAKGGYEQVLERSPGETEIEIDPDNDDDDY